MESLTVLKHSYIFGMRGTIIVKYYVPHIHLNMNTIISINEARENRPLPRLVMLQCQNQGIFFFLRKPITSYLIITCCCIFVSAGIQNLRKHFMEST